MPKLRRRWRQLRRQHRRCMITVVILTDGYKMNHWRHYSMPIASPIDNNPSQHLDDLIAKAKYQWMTMIEGRLDALEQALVDAKEHGKKTVGHLDWRLKELQFITERQGRHIEA